MSGKCEHKWISYTPFRGDSYICCEKAGCGIKQEDWFKDMLPTWDGKPPGEQNKPLTYDEYDTIIKDISRNGIPTKKASDKPIDEYVSAARGIQLQFAELDTRLDVITLAAGSRYSYRLSPLGCRTIHIVDKTVDRFFLDPTLYYDFEANGVTYIQSGKRIQ